MRAMSNRSTPNRVAIYARYSSDNQREASIDDQVEVCRRYIGRQGWALGTVYSDRAISGATRMRPGYQQLLNDAEAGVFDVVVCEALDRLARNLSDVAGAFDRLRFCDVALHAVATGEVTQLHIGMLGTMSQLYLSDLRDKTKRGQLGRALKGKIPGGKAYGYAVVEGKGDGGGERQIIEHEAAVVRRIFRDYVAGVSPRTIAKKLNAEGIPGPKGNTWRDTTIRGETYRGTGILNNAIYVGRLEWNRCSYVKNPKTGKRVARANPKEQWEIIEIPGLQIIEEDLWRRAKERQQVMRFTMKTDNGGNLLNGTHRRRFLFSGLLKCGHCGSAYVITSKDRYGCSNHRSKGVCANARTITRQIIEARILSGLKDKLMAPELVEAFIDEYRKEENRLATERHQGAEADRCELENIKRRIEGVLKAIEDGNYHSSLTERLTTLEARKCELERTNADNPNSSQVLLHPNLAKVYRDKIKALEDALNAPDCRTEAAEVLHGLIEHIVLTPTEDAIKAELTGDLAAILALCTGPNGGSASVDLKSQFSVVAGEGFEPPTHGL